MLLTMLGHDECMVVILPNITMFGAGGGGGGCLISRACKIITRLDLHIRDMGNVTM